MSDTEPRTGNTVMDHVVKHAENAENILAGVTMLVTGAVMFVRGAHKVHTFMSRKAQAKATGETPKVA